MRSNDVRLLSILFILAVVLTLIPYIRFTGNIFDTMNRIDAIGNDLIMYNSGGSGGCGKAGQAPLPIGRGGPHLVIRDVIVGGR